MGKSFVLIALALSVVVGCMGRLAPVHAPPTRIGPHPVGVTTLEVKDAARGRKLEVEAWYPAAEAPIQGKPEIYDVEAGLLTVARLRSVANTRRNVPSLRGARLPVVLLSHGAGSTRYANVGLAEVLASHGYIVAAPDHDGHTVSDKLTGISDDDRAQSALDRPLDLSAVLDDLARRSAGNDPLFRGRVDMNRVAVAGHSFGGRAALGLVGARYDGSRQARECLADDDNRDCPALEVFGSDSYRYRDPRIKAALLITPAGYDFYHADGVAEVDVPVLMVGARKDKTVPYDSLQQPLFDALEGPRHMLQLARAGHLTATDVCAVVTSVGFFAETFGGDQARDGCGAGYLTPQTTLDLVADATLSFFDVYLDHEPDAHRRLELALHPVIVDGPRQVAIVVP